MPIYEYRCPDGHTFEVFQRMSDPPSESCEVCGTDYGRGSGKKKDASKDGGDSGSSDKKPDSGEKKPAPAAD